MTPDWIAVDWGTSSLRLWAMGAEGPLAERRSDKGMGGLAPAAFEPVLLGLLDDWLPAAGRLPVLICGMAGARQGWREAPYAAVPCHPSARPMPVPTADPRLDVAILPGLCQMDPPDVMRGEETQLAGLLAERPDFAGLACLPGTHSKWARLEGGEVTGFATVMTGEVFALLSRQSVLRHSLGEGWDEAAFDAAVAEALAAPARIPALIFGIRAGSLLADLAPDTARARLSGLLIGAELAAIGPVTGPVAIIGDAGIAAPYARALTLAGALPERHDAARLTLAGLAAARKTREIA